MISLSAETLKAAAIIAPDSDTRFYLNGVLLDIGADGKTWIVSTDGHMAFIAYAGIQQGVGRKEIIIPKAALKGLPKGLSLVEIEAVSEKRYSFGDTLFTPIDGKYPDWRRIVPGNDIMPPQERNQFDPELVIKAHKALNTHFGRRKSGGCFNIIQDRGQCGVMRSCDPTAFVVMMPFRWKSKEYAEPLWSVA